MAVRDPGDGVAADGRMVADGWRPRHLQRVRREHAERYRWEKARVPLDEDERRTTGGTEHDTGLRTEELTFHAGYDQVPADPDLAASFGLPVGTPLLRRTYRTSPGPSGTARTSPGPSRAALSLVRSYLPYRLASANPDLLDPDNEPWPGGTQHQLATIGIEVTRIVDEIRGRTPLPDEADLLDLAPGVPVLAVRKICVDAAGRVVEVADVVLPADRTELVYSTDLDPFAATEAPAVGGPTESGPDPVTWAEAVAVFRGDGTPLGPGGSARPRRYRR